MSNYLKKCLFTFINIFFLFSCDLFNNEIKVVFDYDLFSIQYNLWEISKPDNYQYNFFRNNPGFELEMSALIFVENGQYKYQIPEEGIWLTGVTTDYQTIDKIYEKIENIYNTKRYKNDGVYLTKIEMEYDLKNHIPIKTEFYYRVDSGVTDIGNYMLYRIDNFKVN